MNRTLSPRREFLRFLAASPLLAQASAQEPAAGTLSDPKDALSVMDFEPLARKALPPAHWGYLATGVDDDVTLGLNREAFGHYQLRPRRLVDLSNTDLKAEVLGATWGMPIYVSAVAAQKAFHPEGELATARAARSRKTLQMLSTQTSTAVEDVARTLGTPPWFQLYIRNSWEETEKLVRRVETAGCPVLAWTIDFLGGMNPETVIFEFGFGHYAFHRPWRDLASDYDVRRGGMLLFGMLVLLFSPVIAKIVLGSAKRSGP